MATLDRAQALLEELRSASIGGAQQDLKDVQEYAASQVCVHARVCDELGRAKLLLHASPTVACFCVTAFPNCSDILQGQTCVHSIGRGIQAHV